MQEAIQKPNKKEMKNENAINQEIKTDSMLNEAEVSITQSEVIIAFYLLGVKPPWIMRVVYGD